MKQTLLITAPFPELWRDSESVVVIDGIGLDGKVFVDDPKIDVKLVKSPEILCDVDDAEFAQFQATTEAVFQELIHELNRLIKWRRWESNPRPPACKAGALAS